MYGRILIAIAASSLALATAYAQGPASSPGTPGTTTSPGAPGSPVSGYGTSTMGTGTGTMSPGTPGVNAPSQARSGNFDASSYRNPTDCLIAAQAAGLSRDACSGTRK